MILIVFHFFFDLLHTYRETLAAEQAGGWMNIESVSETVDPVNHGTKVSAFFHEDNIDFTPVGDVVSTMLTLIQGHPDTDFLFTHSFPKPDSPGGEEICVHLDTRELREALDGVPLNEYEVIRWIEEYLQEQYSGSSDTE